MYNRRERHPERVEGIEVASSARNLGTDLGNSSSVLAHIRRGSWCWRREWQIWCFCVVYRSCDRLLIGKTYWKSVVQPRVLCASSVVV